MSALSSINPNHGSTHTGLSQSDLSISSSNDSNNGYNYGGQEVYNVDTKEYLPPPVPRTSDAIPHSHVDENGDEEKIDDTIIQINNQENEDPNRPVITAAIFKQEPIKTGPAALQNGIANSDDGSSRLMSDILAEESQAEEKLLEEQRQLGNGAIADENNTIHENGDAFDSLAYLPEPPSSDEIKQLNDVVSNMENSNMDSLPPPPPPEISIAIIADGQNGNIAIES